MASKRDQIAAIYPLSPMQESMLCQDLLDPSSTVNLVRKTFRLDGDLDNVALEAAWAHVMARHPILRTLFVWKNGSEPKQVVLKKVKLPLTRHDWTTLNDDQADSALQELVDQDSVNGIAHNKAPLMRLHLVCRGPVHHDLVWSYHHILLDGWSVGLVIGELLASYERFKRKLDSDLPRAPAFRGYLNWLGHRDRDRACSWWKQYLSGFTAATPIIRSPGETKPGEHPDSRLEERALDRDQTKRLQECARSLSATPSHLLHVAWSLLLRCYADRDDVVFGTVVSGRPGDLPGVEAMAGLFINTLPVRVIFHPGETAADLVKRFVIDHLEREERGWLTLSEICTLSDAQPGVPLFESLLVMQNFATAQGRQGKAGSLSIIERPGRVRGHYPLVLAINPGHELVLSAWYDPAHFERRVIARLLGHFRAVITAITVDPGIAVDDLSLFTGCEQELVDSWNATSRVNHREGLAARWFIDQARATPNALALVHGDEHLTYAQLLDRAIRIRSVLTGRGIGPGMVTAVHLPRSADAVAAILAVVMTGSAWLPLTMGLPEDRVHYMLADSGAVLVLAQPESMNYGETPVLHIVPGLVPDRCPALDLPRRFPDNLAYVIYTSGSTGRPKGVMVTHRGLANQLFWRQEVFGVGPGDRVLQNIALGFDPSVWQILWPLCNGAALVLLDEEHQKDGRRLARHILEDHVTVAAMVPSMLRVLLDEGLFQATPYLRHISVGGEPLTATLQDRFLSETGLEGVLHVVYGPTETTIDATSQPAFSGSDPAVTHIGRPILNTRIHVVDHLFRPLPAGVPGELMIEGPGLARGYCGRPAKTAAQFVPDPFSATPGERLYRSGDLGAWLHNGNIEFLGRIDNQVKVRGFRIEPGEIEAALESHALVGEAVVTADHHQGERRLAVYLTSSQKEKGLTSDHLASLRNYLRRTLPAHMSPASWNALESMPRTINGKVDRKALPEPRFEEAEAVYTAPADAVEEQLAGLWGELLGRSPVSVTADFFSLGGHSLLALRLAARIQRETGRELPMAVLFERPTIRQMAELLRADVPSTPATPLVALQSRGEGAPVFAVHPLGGNPMCYAGLAKQLGSERPFYGIRSPALYGAEPATTLEAMAAGYVQEIRAIQPDGPYALCGWSLGGVIAYEMACQILREGQEIFMLALFDTYSPRESYQFDDDADLMAFLVEDYAATLGRNLAVDRDRFRERDEITCLRIAAEMLSTHLPDTAEPPLDELQRLWRAHKSNVFAGLDHELTTYPGHIDFFEAREKLADRPLGPVPGWRDLVLGDLTVHPVPGTHHSLLQSPHVDELTRVFDAALCRRTLEPIGEKP